MTRIETLVHRDAPIADDMDEEELARAPWIDFGDVRIEVEDGAPPPERRLSVSERALRARMAS